jgi:hypothetical protein
MGDFIVSQFQSKRVFPASWQIIGQNRFRIKESRLAASEHLFEEVVI